MHSSGNDWRYWDYSTKGDTDSLDNNDTIKNGSQHLRNAVEAYVWASILAANGYSDAEEARDAMAEYLTKDQLEDAQRRAVELFDEIKANE